MLTLVCNVTLYNIFISGITPKEEVIKVGLRRWYETLAIGMPSIVDMTNGPGNLVKWEPKKRIAEFNGPVVPSIR